MHQGSSSPKAGHTRHNAGEPKLRRFCGQITTTEMPPMSVKFEGEPPFYLGIAETAAAQVLDTNVIIRVTVSTSQARLCRFDSRLPRKLQNRWQNS